MYVYLKQQRCDRRANLKDGSLCDTCKKKCKVDRPSVVDVCPDYEEVDHGVMEQN